MRAPHWPPLRAALQSRESLAHVSRWHLSGGGGPRRRRPLSPRHHLRLPHCPLLGYHLHSLVLLLLLLDSCHPHPLLLGIHYTRCHPGFPALWLLLLLLPLLLLLLHGVTHPLLLLH